MLLAFLWSLCIYYVYIFLPILMTTKVATWGNSLGIRIPKGLLEEAQLAVGDPVDIELVGNKIIISSSEDETLEEMMKRAKPGRHKLLLHFEPIGREVW